MSKLKDVILKLEAFSDDPVASEICAAALVLSGGKRDAIRALCASKKPCGTQRLVSWAVPLRDVFDQVRSNAVLKQELTAQVLRQARTFLAKTDHATAAVKTIADRSSDAEHSNAVGNEPDEAAELALSRKQAVHCEGQGESKEHQPLEWRTGKSRAYIKRDGVRHHGPWRACSEEAAADQAALNSIPHGTAHQTAAAQKEHILAQRNREIALGRAAGRPCKAARTMFGAFSQYPTTPK